MRFADTRATQERGEQDFDMRDAVVMGLTQCLALIPGVSRSGATLTAGLLRGLDRVTVTRMSFFLAIPALTAAGVLEAATKSSEIADGVGWGPTLVALVTASSSPTRPSPGCCATSPATTSRCSSSTGSRSASSSSGWSRPGVTSAT